MQPASAVPNHPVINEEQAQGLIGREQKGLHHVETNYRDSGQAECRQIHAV